MKILSEGSPLAWLIKAFFKYYRTYLTKPVQTYSSDLQKKRLLFSGLPITSGIRSARMLADLLLESRVFGLLAVVVW